MTKQDYLDAMNGVEIWTDLFGERQCVGVEGNKVCSEGRVIARLTLKTAKALWAELCEQDGIHHEMELLREEFGQ